VLDIADYLITKHLEGVDHDAFIENSRGKLVAGLKAGYQLAINFDKNIEPTQNLD